MPAAQFEHVSVGRDLFNIILQHFGGERRPDPEMRHRRTMMEKVRSTWETHRPAPSLPPELLRELGLCKHPVIELQLVERPATITDPLDSLMQHPNRTDQPLPPGTRLADRIDKPAHALLILGEPGAGKTTLLLALTQDLLDRAELDSAYPIPVVLQLSSWATQRRPLTTWLVEALNEQYQVPPRLGQAWVSTDQILPLLDGLDEVPQEHRTACIQAINTFRQDHGHFPLVVCSRTAAYEESAIQLQFQQAVVVQPLTPPQVDAYLTQIGQPLAAVRQAMHKDPLLWELLSTPLMLTIVTLAYAGEPAAVLRKSGTLEARRQALFTVYVDEMFRRGKVSTAFAPEQTRYWLAWLAWQMEQHSLTIFYLERLQPDWLPQGQRWVPTQGVRVVAGILGGLLAGLLGWLFGNLADGLAFGLIVGLIGGVAGYSKEIRSTEFVRWTWSAFHAELFFPSRRGLRFGLLGGLVGGLLMWIGPQTGTGLIGFGVALSFIIVSWLGVRLMSAGLVVSLIIVLGPPNLEGNSMAVGLAAGFSFGFIYKLCAAFIAGLSSGEMSTKNTPNEGIYRSGRIAVISGLGGGLIIGLVAGVIIGLVAGVLGGLANGLLLGWYLSLSSWLIIAVGIGLRYGGRTCLQHLLLRLMLRYHGFAPWRYVNFLDYATEHIFLRKVGGGYMFIHRLLQDHFAARHKEPADGAHIETAGRERPARS